ncbi:hypothetical protein HKX48_000559 [Thoreauomyces humboldtii]|nr:hypothetical protein HKX48_000559 [Thoreauomyces humboldtii]
MQVAAKIVAHDWLRAGLAAEADEVTVAMAFKSPHHRQLVSSMCAFRGQQASFLKARPLGERERCDEVGDESNLGLDVASFGAYANAPLRMERRTRRPVLEDDIVDD